MTTKPDVSTVLPDENGIWSGVHEYQIELGSEFLSPTENRLGLGRSAAFAGSWDFPQDYKLVEHLFTKARFLKPRPDCDDNDMSVISEGWHILSGEAPDWERYAYNVKKGQRFQSFSSSDSTDPEIDRRHPIVFRLRCWYDIPWWQKGWAEVRNNPAPYAAVVAAAVTVIVAVVPLITACAV